MKQLPKQITIGGKLYKVYRRNKIIKDNEACWGYCDTDKCEIEITTRNVSVDHQLETLLHECLHALEEHLDIEMDEDDIRKLSKGIYALLKDNLV